MRRLWPNCRSSEKIELSIASARPSSCSRQRIPRDAVIEQLGAERPLERRDATAEGGVIDPKLLRAGGELPRSRDRQERPYQIPVERLAHDSVSVRYRDRKEKGGPQETMTRSRAPHRCVSIAVDQKSATARR